MLDDDHSRSSAVPGEPLPGLDDRSSPGVCGIGDVGGATLRIGLIDRYRLSRECLAGALADVSPSFDVVAFSTAQDCILADVHPDLILYCNHASGLAGAADVSTIRRMLPLALLVILSDAEDAEQPHVIRSAVRQGARGFIPTQAIGIPMLVAALRLVRAGGIYAPLDILLSLRATPSHEAPPARAKSPLTSRELMVLGHVHQGKANKMIAYELGMKESTVKVHVRHIMRKTGASNRVQAAYTARNLWNLLPAQSNGCAP